MRILYFAWVRETIGLGEETVDPPCDVTSIETLIAWLTTRSAGHAAAFADRSRLRAAVDQVFGSLDASIEGAREIAIFPPVNGG